MKVRELIERLKDMPDWMDVVIELKEGGQGEAVSVDERGGIVSISTDQDIYQDYPDCPHCGC